ncbi:putative sun domain protein [Diaporthe ampelina]|uniref:Putative sun domain protein n=1 Tax=Diaporthe ampelina TaxID=1214573 RepID=A0A0G2FUC2_9PEZI|nr:putative sun domain protein [Diaporthe ampelina]
MDGGLYCDESGKIVKPFPDQPYCVQGVGSVKAVNKCGKVVAFCQTVLPGNEAMLIPTRVTDSATIAVPGPSYWDSTASHFYINPPGHTTEEACIWGTGSQHIGNWSPYVAGANQDTTGNTYVKLGYNPIYTDSFHGVKPSFGLKVECDGNCNGLPCAIDPSSDGFGVVRSATSASGAGGADFCVFNARFNRGNFKYEHEQQLIKLIKLTKLIKLLKLLKQLKQLKQLVLHY